MCLFITDPNRRPVLTRGMLRTPGKMLCLLIYNMGFLPVLNFSLCLVKLSVHSLYLLSRTSPSEIIIRSCSQIWYDYS